MNLKEVIKTPDYKEVIIKSSIALLIRIIGFISGYLFIYFTVKTFGAETQGRLSLSFSFMIIGALICRSGLDVNFVKVFAINKNFENAKGIYFKVIPFTLVISLAVSFVVFFLAEKLSVHVFNDPELEGFLKWTSPCIVLFTFVLINAGVFRGLKKNALYVFLFNGGRFLFTLLFFAIFTLAFNKDALITIKAHTLSIFTLFLVSFFFIRKFLFPRSIDSTYSVNSFFKDSLPMFLSASMIVLLGWSDTIILGIFRDSQTVGMYSVVLKIAAVTSFTLQALDSILAPKLSNAYHDDNMILFKKLVKFSIVINTIISSIIITGLLIFQDFILGIFGSDFLEGAFALTVLCIGQLVNAIFGPVGSIFQMTGHQKVFQNILLVSLLVNLILNISLAKQYGINGVAIATAISLIVSKILSAIYIKRRIWVIDN